MSDAIETYTVVYQVSREKHDEWWRVVKGMPDGIRAIAFARFDALEKLDELEVFFDD